MFSYSFMTVVFDSVESYQISHNDLIKNDLKFFLILCWSTVELLQYCISSKNDF